MRSHVCLRSAINKRNSAAAEPSNRTLIQPEDNGIVCFLSNMLCVLIAHTWRMSSLALANKKSHSIEAGIELIYTLLSHDLSRVDV